MTAALDVIGYLLAAVVVLIFLLVVSATALVAMAVRREEKLGSLGERAPDVIAALARALLAVYAPRKADELFPRDRPRSCGRSRNHRW